MTRPLFKLKPRLKMCADFVTKGSRIVDVGTDHAYLPIWLVKSDIIDFAVASDLKEGPLKNAKANIDKYGVSDIIVTRLSDGLSNIHGDEVDEVIIAGMGGELIADIISKAPWLKTKKLILQPMTASVKLREFLREKSYCLSEEKAVEDDGKVYTVMCVKPGVDNIIYDALYPYVGRLDYNMDDSAKKYIEREIYHLGNQSKGVDNNEAVRLEDIICRLKELLKDC